MAEDKKEELKLKKKEQIAEPAETERRSSLILSNVDHASLASTRSAHPSDYMPFQLKDPAQLRYEQELAGYMREVGRYQQELRRWEALPRLKRVFAKKPEPPVAPRQP